MRAQIEAVKRADAYTSDAGLPTYTDLVNALQKIHTCGISNAADYMPELEGMTQSEFSAHLMMIAEKALFQK